MDSGMARTDNDNDANDLKPETRLVVAGRNSAENHGFVNPPVIHASTVLYPNAADMVAHRARYTYGRRGTPTSEALEDALRAIEGPGCAGVCLVPSGAAAVSTALLSVVARRRSHSDYRQRLPPDARLCRQHPEEARRRDHLLRSADRRRDRQADAAEYARGVSSKRPARNPSRCRTSRPSRRSRAPKARSC